MFQSIRNNFGAGTIQFKDVRESNYIVLNATFTYRTDSPEYQAADVLEITVPDLNIDRSTIAGVVMRFIDRQTSYSYLIVSDGGTILKSWIKDKNTICIEKLTDFDDQEEMIIYIQTIYLQLNQGGNAKKGIKKSLSPKQPETYLYWGSSNFCVVYPKWVFIHIDFSSSKYAYRDSDWRCTDQESNFTILTNTYCAAVLTENGFQDCEESLRFLESDYGKEAIIGLHVDGILDFIDPDRPYGYKDLQRLRNEGLIPARRTV